MHAYKFPVRGWSRYNDKTSQNSPFWAKFLNLDISSYLTQQMCKRAKTVDARTTDLS